MKDYLPHAGVFLLGAVNAMGGVLGEQPSGVVVISTSVIALLGGGLVWVLKHVLGTVIPELNKTNTANVERICGAFEQRGREDRRAGDERHDEIVRELRAIRGRVHGNGWRVGEAPKAPPQ